MVPDADLRIKLPVFEGPLDLLLFLIRKNELDIYDIPISTVTRQYIAVLRSMQELDLEIAGEFFVMAASLMEIKSRMLLPRGQAAVGESEDDDPLDPRWELVHQLLQYKKFKEAAAKLDELAAFQRDMLARHVVEVAVTENERPLKPVDRIELWNAFNIVLRRLSEKLVVGEIKGEEVTVSDKMEELLLLVETRKRFLFTDLFEGQPVTVRLLVATFIAVLELTRLKKLRVRQDEAYSDIHIEAVENIVNPDGTLAEGQLNFAPAEPGQTAPTIATAPALDESAPASPAVADMAEIPVPPTAPAARPDLAPSVIEDAPPSGDDARPAPVAVADASEPRPQPPPTPTASIMDPGPANSAPHVEETPAPVENEALAPQPAPPFANESPKVLSPEPSSASEAGAALAGAEAPAVEKPLETEGEQRTLTT